MPITNKIYTMDLKNEKFFISIINNEDDICPKYTFCVYCEYNMIVQLIKGIHKAEYKPKLIYNFNFDQKFTFVIMIPSLKDEYKGLYLINPKSFIEYFVNLVNTYRDKLKVF